MKLEQFVKEEWEETTKIGKETYEIFKNPSNKEMMGLKAKDGEVRFIAFFPTKTLYAFNGDLLHHIAYYKINIPNDL